MRVLTTETDGPATELELRAHALEQTILQLTYALEATRGKLAGCVEALEAFEALEEKVALGAPEHSLRDAHEEAVTCLNMALRAVRGSR